MSKIVIDLDDSLYDAIQTVHYVIGMRSGKTLLQKLITTIRNGTPLDDIKAEIDNQYKWLMQTDHTLYDIDIAFDAIKQIIDHHTGKEKVNEKTTDSKALS